MGGHEKFSPAAMIGCIVLVTVYPPPLIVLDLVETLLS